MQTHSRGRPVISLSCVNVSVNCQRDQQLVCLKVAFPVKVTYSCHKIFVAIANPLLLSTGMEKVGNL